MYEKFGLAVAAAILAVSAGASGLVAQEATRAPLERIQSVYGLAIDPSNTGHILIGTGHGLLRATPDGMAEIIAPPRAAVVGLGVDPNEANKLILSGVSETGVAAGLFTLDTDGANWTEVPGTRGENGIAMTSLSVSRLDSARLAGVNKTIHLSSDGGVNWTSLETTPEKTFSVALSSIDTSRIFIATMSGLMVSHDEGKNWQKSYSGETPATTVASLSGGRVAAFVLGTGLIMADEEMLNWQVVGTGFEDRYLRVLVEDPSIPETFYAVADTGAILLSRDEGKSWVSFEGNNLADPDRIAAGNVLYDDNCASCHGVGGTGEEPENPAARDEFGFKAPALNNDMHAWHHSDTGLRATIREGSPRNERMSAWQDVLSDDEIDSILAYIKSTWSIPSLACQGARHMACMKQ
ncbi:c-type cytochrome [Aliiroseovarius sp. KMU-50]|uniref:C-type cytochrome n=1 Tax=Aliiroseovarius salicola TaxID=3009082 RepID=A0ABT4W5I9_9RHOB|nr:c-type cytochrome [Aliiroseovarius sp. KMU-50]MDA5095787.1 c-type cytochrome [Aliiroseovarius sp. KMU-50]